ncbi:aromatic ring-hydroxylating dioxygenase subunit alpha [Robertmurraya yapensis]|uniref:Aromatic ring-hydroxylating dioxygenase subunit alpha n=1 Tax=Bacillus yapensis TaxID=2492960 RepID=A0A431W171_9BACI|nr:aromatic ring-hydroxylating dioxygenase subunit alpha [Bacillus yapensis]RTR29175.1 aromatic ring-hydroxylating dioxygenase subunit alpha [Bacillus yapensis]TKS94780.1 aromatic ring-hydroxylating dioxygenase subunit alpha [Bacillus yapensis]
MVLENSAVNELSNMKPTLKGPLYTSSEIFALEKEHIYSKEWIFVGYECDVAEAGQYITLNVEGENIVIVRGKDYVLRAFLNVCRHRGAKLCTDPCGKRAVLQCPYHSWSYGLDGNLLSVPNTTEFKEELVNKPAYALESIHVRTWHGLIWLSFSENPRPIEQQLDTQILLRFGELDTFARYNLASLKVAHSKEYEVKANWKLIVENFQECYHCSAIHPELTAAFPSFKSGVGTQNGIGTGAELRDDLHSFSISGKKERPKLKGLLPEDDRLYFGMTILPHVFINLTPDHIIIHRIIPISADHSKVICDWLFDPDEIAKPDFDPSDAVELFHRTNEQDFVACEWCQENMGSKAYKNGGVLVPVEQHVSVFYNYVLEAIGLAGK